MFNSTINVGCSFQIDKYDSEDNIIYSGEEFHNLTLDCGISSMFVRSLHAMSTWLNIGTSAIPPSLDQTGLISRSFSTSTLFNNQSSTFISYYPTPYYELKKTFQFNVGTCTGSFNEIGLSYSNNETYLNRQLIKDANGNPVTINVLASEGLRITVKSRLYMSPNNSWYSQVYEFDRKEATSGTVTFYNGSTTKTIDYADIVDRGLFQKALQTWLGAPKIQNVVNSDTSTFHILCHKLNQLSMNITIQSHTLIGGSGEPVLTEVQPFALAPINSFTLTNITTNETKEIHYTTHQAFLWDTEKVPHTGVPGLPIHGWSNGLYSFFIHANFSQAAGYVNDGAGSSQTTVTPYTVENGYYENKLYLAPGVLGIGPKDLTSFNSCINGYAWEVFTLDQNITLQDYEEFNMIFRFNFGRYIQ